MAHLLGDLRPQLAGSKRRAAVAGLAATPGTSAAVAPRPTRLKKNRRLKDDLPAKADLFLPESRMYTQLLALEQRLDASILRKHIEVQDFMVHPPRATNVLRIQIFNEYHNQPSGIAAAAASASASASGSGGNGAMGGREPLPGQLNTNSDDKTTVLDTKGGVEDEPPSWTLKITGHLIEPTTGQPVTGTPFVFSNFVHKMFVELDPKVYTDALNVIEVNANPTHTESLRLALLHRAPALTVVSCSFSGRKLQHLLRWTGLRCVDAAIAMCTQKSL